MAEQSHLEAMREAIKGDLERARSRRPSIFERPAPRPVEIRAPADPQPAPVDPEPADAKPEAAAVNPVAESPPEQESPPQREPELASEPVSEPAAVEPSPPPEPAPEPAAETQPPGPTRRRFRLRFWRS